MNTSTDGTTSIPPLDKIQKIDDLETWNQSGRWETNQWYSVPFDSLVCIQTKGATFLSFAQLKGLISFNGVITNRGALQSVAKYKKGLAGDSWITAEDSFNFPYLTGEQFMVFKSAWSPLPDLLEVSIQVIPYPRPNSVNTQQN